MNDNNNDNIQPFTKFETLDNIDLNSYSKLDKIKNFIYKKKIYFLSSFLFLLTLIIIIIISKKKKKNENKEKEENEEYDTNSEKEEIDQDVEPFSNYYSLKTKNYLNLINEYEINNTIIYHYNFYNDSKPSFANKYQYLYENDTSLIPNDSEVGNYLFHEESYLTHETDEINYYKNILKKDPKKHYIYGPSYIKEEYINGQKLYNPNVKLNSSKDWEGITLSINVKQQPLMGNNNGGHFFGWGTSHIYQKPGFLIAISNGVIVFRSGKYNSRYDYADAVKLGYNESIPEKRYLTWRPLTDERWHQIIISMRKVNKNDEIYLEDLSIKEGNYKCELFIDGESRKNTTADIRDDYGNLTAFNFSNQKGNPNFYIDNIIVLKKGINITEAKILFESIDQEAKIVIPDIPNERCKIPGEQYGLKPEEIYPDSIYPLKAETKFFQLTNKWTCIGFLYENYIKERLEEFCSEHLKAVDLNYYYGKIQEYQLKSNYYYDVLDIIKYFGPKINEQFKNLENFRKIVKIKSSDINGNDEINHVISNFGYWISSEGLLEIKKFAEETRGIIRVSITNVNYFAYYEIEGGYHNNRIYTISIENCDDIKFIYDEKKVISYAIKINQVGYSPLVKNHYGYIGRWMGSFGKLPLDEYVGKEFKLMQNEKEVYKGVIQWRTEEDPKYVSNGFETDLNGEQTLLLDISNYTGNGENYYFYIEGIGISLPFSISYKSVFTSFYMHMKGLYNQRTGIDHKKPYTYWELPAQHKGIYVAHHIPNNYHYNEKYITDDDTGEGFGDIKQFDMIKETKTDEFWEDVFGGHADAGDYDNRPYHLQLVDILSCVFLLKKKFLFDNQLNIPENNDNIPDILNELEWGLQIHYKVQEKLNNGSVSTWIESTSHPTGLLENGTDPDKYYVGLSTREDTLRYAEAAAMLSLCFKECEICPEEKYKKWLKSAEWAFDWGINENNTCVYSFKFKGRNLTYREPDVPEEYIARAALVLYRITHSDKYKKYIFLNINATKRDEKYTKGVIKLEDLRGKINPIDAMPAVLFKDDPDFDLFLTWLNNSCWRHINTIIKFQNNETQYTYRNAYYYPSNHVYYSSLGWGGYIGSNQLSMLAIGLYLNYGTEQGEKILQVISYYYDFSLGCNHFGRTFTTGLGHHYPIHFVSHNNWWFNNKGIHDPIPGITLYTFFGGIEYESIYRFYKIYAERDDKNTFSGINLPLCPSFFNLSEIPTEYKDIRNHLWQTIPFWRRSINLEGYTIKSSEYTIYETIVKLALASGLLLGNDENVDKCNGLNDCPSLFPSDELKNLSPKEDIKDLLGRWSIP